MSGRKQALAPSGLPGTLSQVALNNREHVSAPSWHWPYYIGLGW